MSRIVSSRLVFATLVGAMLLGIALLPAGCGGDDIRELPNGEVPVPTPEEKAQLKTDYSQK